MVGIVRPLCSGPCSLFSLISCHHAPYSLLSKHTGILHTLWKQHTLFHPRHFTLFSLGCHQLGEVAPDCFNLNRPLLFIFMLWFFFSCEFIPSSNYIFISPKYKPHEGRKLVCFVYYIVSGTYNQWIHSSHPQLLNEWNKWMKKHSSDICVIQKTNLAIEIELPWVELWSTVDRLLGICRARQVQFLFQLWPKDSIRK